MSVINNPFFNGDFLGRHASLNRLVINRLPEGDFPSNWQGKTGIQLLSSQAIIDQVIAHKDLHPPSSIDTLHYPEYLDSLMKKRSSSEHQAVEEIFSTYGKAIACIILTATEGLEENRSARPDWDDACWAFWVGRNPIYLGGGLVSGLSAEIILFSARKALAQSGKELSLYKYPRFLPLIGTARSLPVEDGMAVVFDMGHTTIKRGLVFVKDRKIEKLTVLPSFPVKRDFTVYDIHQPVNVAEFRRYIYTGITETLRSQYLKDSVRAVGISVANYFSKGQMADRGIYSSLNEAGLSFEENITRHTEFGGPLRVFHDGTASGICMSEEPDGALLVLGSAIGVGFPVIKPELDLDLEKFQLCSAP